MNIYRQSMQMLAYLILLGCVASCGKMDAIYSDFLEEGEIIYPAKADSLRAHAGDYRIALSWVVLSDPNVSRAVVYWDNRRDSVTVSIANTQRPDTITVILENMEEKAYTFEVFTYDDRGNMSVKAEVLGIVYGDAYRSGLLTRAVRSLTAENDTLVVAWMPAEQTSVGDMLYYADSEGESQQVFVPAMDDTTRLPSFVQGNNFVYQTLFKPDPVALDTFRTNEFEMEVDPDLFKEEAIELAKSRFSPFYLPTDTYEPNAPNTTMDRIWDGVLVKNDPTFITRVGTAMPQWFTFDIGVVARLERMRIHQRGVAANRYYNGGNVREAEIWGSVAPNPDGSWDDSWVLLGTFESFKPSGPGAVTQQDIDYAMQGEVVLFDESAPAVRYVRFKTISNWDAANRGYTNIGQLTFWGFEE